MDSVQLIQQLSDAIESRAWYPAIGIAIMIVIAAWRKVQPQVWDRIPTQWKWLPALALSTLTAFVDAATSGLEWPVAVGVALFTLATTTWIAIGSADQVLRVAGLKEPPLVRR